MKTRVLIPRILQEYVQGKSGIDVAGETVGDLLDELKLNYPQLYVCICDETGSLRQHINLFLNDQLLPVPAAFGTSIESGDTLSVFQAVSGG
ncbi:MAG: MoaD/ThiS family protein [Pirellulaceae bacterium]